MKVTREEWRTSDFLQGTATRSELRHCLKAPARGFGGRPSLEPSFSTVPLALVSSIVLNHHILCLKIPNAELDTSRDFRRVDSPSQCSSISWKKKKKINKEGIFWEFCTELSGMIKPIESALHWENKEEENLGFSEGIIINDPTSREWVDSVENSKKSMVNF